MTEVKVCVGRLHLPFVRYERPSHDPAFIRLGAGGNPIVSFNVYPDSLREHEGAKVEVILRVIE